MENQEWKKPLKKLIEQKNINSGVNVQAPFDETGKAVAGHGQQPGQETDYKRKTEHKTEYTASQNSGQKPCHGFMFSQKRIAVKKPEPEIDRPPGNSGENGGNYRGSAVYKQKQNQYFQSSHDK